MLLRRILLLIALAAPFGCSSTANDDEPLLTEEQRAELKAVVDKRMSEVTREVRLSQATQDEMRPFVKASVRKLILASRRYRENPTPKTLRRYESDARQIGAEMKKNLQPLMTAAQLNHFMIVIDRVIQDTRGSATKAQ